MKRCLACEHEWVGDSWDCPSCGWSPERLEGYACFAPDEARGREGFAPEYYARLFALESGNFWFQSRNRLVEWALRRFFNGATRVLEVGCGTGYVLAGIARALPGARLTASEILVDGLAHAGARTPAAELIQMDARRIPFTGEFDLAGLFDVLEHVDEDERVLRELHRALVPGGGILITVPQHRFLWSQADEYAMHKRRYRRAELLARLAGTGFRVLHATSFVSLLLPLLLVSRATKRDPARYDPEAEFSIPRWLNAALGGVMTAERALLSWGVSLPAGGSLLVAARREG